MALSVFFASLLHSSSAAGPPSAQSLGSSWQASPLRAMPVVQNFIGAATLRDDGGYAYAPGGTPGVGIAALGPLTLTPFRGNFFNASMTFNGRALYVNDTAWSLCEGSRNAIGDRLTVVNRVRLPFEDAGVMQQWDIHTDDEQIVVESLLDGPFFRQCDEDGAQMQLDCGWGTGQPTDRENFHSFLREFEGLPTIMITTDTLTNASAASAIWCEGRGSCDSVSIDLAETLEDSGGFRARVVAQVSSVTLRHAVAVASSESEAIAKLRRGLLGDALFEQAFSQSCIKFEKRWEEAFEADGEHFSGSLPVMSSNSEELDRLYHWAALALVSLERTNLKSFPRQFVISEGPSNSLRGDQNMGGSGQFVWDISFSATSLSLLEPEGTRHVLQYIITHSDLQTEPIGLPQTWDLYPADYPVQPGIYCFDFIATFLLFQQYVVTTGDHSMISQEFVNERNASMSISGLEFLRRVAWHWMSYERSEVSPFLVDYGNDKRFFLEAVPTYYGVVPALQFSNAGMLLSLARLLELPSIAGSASEIAALRGNATAIARDALRFQQVPGTGYWNCLHANGSAPTEVRAVSDMIYVGIATGLVGREPSLLPEELRKGVVGFFERELQADGWLRAFSLSDPSMTETFSLEPSVLGRLAMRADWTATGAYGGLPGLAVDALADYEQGLGAAMSSLRNTSLVARVTMPGQSIAVTTPPFMAAFMDNNRGLPLPQGPFAPNFPEFFDRGTNPEFPDWWPSTSRIIQNAEAAITDAFIRSVFGWRPDWDAAAGGASDAKAAIDAALFLPAEPRPGFHGVLSGLRTPHGLIDITASEAGLSWKFSMRDVAAEALFV